MLLTGPDLEGDVILHLVDEVDHLGRQDVTLVQHSRQLWWAKKSKSNDKRQKVKSAHYKSDTRNY